MAVSAIAMLPLSSGYVPMHVVRPNAGTAVKMTVEVAKPAVSEADEPVAQVPVQWKSAIKLDSGVTKPLNFWDPASLMANDEQYRTKYAYYKEAEIKHGRFAMLGALGFLVGEQWHPLFGGNIDVPSLYALQAPELDGFLSFLLVAISAFEIQTAVPLLKEETGPGDDMWEMVDDHVPGDIGWFNGRKIAKENPEKFKAIQTKEINNGRLAMIGIFGMICQELATGQKIF